jgi:hypothetical protein
VQKALTVQDSYRLLVGAKLNGKMKVRRHTITECERLQGFPAGWTKAVDEKLGFKLLGNAVTTNVVAFVGDALCKFFKKKKSYLRTTLTMSEQKPSHIIVAPYDSTLEDGAVMICVVKKEVFTRHHFLLRLDDSERVAPSAPPLVIFEDNVTDTHASYNDPRWPFKITKEPK